MTLDFAHEQNPPAVMCFSGSDPTGGAGIQADIETISSLGAHCCPVITAVTVQNTANAIDYHSVEPGLLAEQARAVLDDIPIKAFKVGMIGSTLLVEALHTLFIDFPHIPVIIDPVLKAGGGRALVDQGEFIEAVCDLLVPLATIVTPNHYELSLLSRGNNSLTSGAKTIMQSGCEHVLATGGDDAYTERVINHFWSHNKHHETFSWDRLPDKYHGSGCTLASAIAAYIAHGAPVESAVRDAQQFTHHCLEFARKLGKAQRIPYRLFWTKHPLNSTAQAPEEDENGSRVS